MNDTAAVERALMTALATIRDDWAALTSPSLGGSIAGPSAPKSLIKHHDNSERTDDLPRDIVILSLRHDVTLALNSWARLIVEETGAHPVGRCDHGSTVTLKWPRVGPTRVRCASGIQWSVDDEGRPQSGLHPITGTDTIGLIEYIERWARWFSGHEAVQDAVDELSAFANQVHATAAPEPRDWMPLGACPLDTVTEDFTPCGGQVRAYHGKEPACHKCGTEGSVAWWERIMFPDIETSELVTADELVTLLHRAFGGAPIKPSTIRQWIRRDVIPTHSKDDKGRTLFSRKDVIDAVEARHAVND